MREHHVGIDERPLLRHKGSTMSKNDDEVEASRMIVYIATKMHRKKNYKNRN